MDSATSDLQHERAGVTMPFDMGKHTIVLNCDYAFQYDLTTLDDIKPNNYICQNIYNVYAVYASQSEPPRPRLFQNDMELTVREWVRLGFRQTESGLYMEANDLSSRALDTLHDSLNDKSLYR